MIVPKQKIIKGEKDKQKRKCIYYNGSVKDGKTKYQEIAHAIPEALGNTKFIQREECDACNDYFARNAEDSAEKIAGEVKDMFCHLVIDLNKELCTRSDDGAKLVQR